MSWLFVGVIYGIGFGISIIGGVLYLLLLSGPNSKPNPLKVLRNVILWPITWGVIAYKVWRG